MDPALEQSKPTSKWIFGTPISRMLASALAAGREILRQKSGADEMPAGPEALLKSCGDLVEHRGEASGLALAEQILSAYEALSDEEKAVFFNGLADDFLVDPERIDAAVQHQQAETTPASLGALRKALAKYSDRCLLAFIDLVGVDDRNRECIVRNSRPIGGCPVGSRRV